MLQFNFAKQTPQPTPKPAPPQARTFLKLYTSPDVNKLNVPDVTKFPPQYFSGNQLLSLYNVPSVKPISPAKTSTIAIVVAFSYKNVLADLKIYWQNSINFGAASDPPKVNIYTMPGAKSDSGWALEECLDVQMVCTINPNATICVVEATSASVTDLLAAVDYATNVLKADVISMSWGLDDNRLLTQFPNRFTNPTTTYCAASGDSNRASWPSVLSNCVSVGGTSLIWSPNGSPTRIEFPWKNAGCGYSSSVPQPSYQSNVSGISRTNRAIPDVSMIADDKTSVYSVYNGNWYGVGGTSVSTPIFSGVVSLINQSRFNLGKGALSSVYNNASMPSNNIQNYLYKTILPNPAKYSACFYDISIGTDLGSVGGNSNKSNNLITYTASTGYDLTTGIGSPNATTLCEELSSNIA